MAYPGTLRAPAEMLLQVEELRTQARARVTEVDLLIAALRDNLQDLRVERERLLSELARARAHIEAISERQALEQAKWLWRGMKAPRD